MFFKIPPELMQYVVVGLFILFGAIVHATAQLKIARDSKQVFTGTDFLILSVIAAFSGILFGLLATIAFNNQILVLICSGVGAFLGMAGLNKFAATMLEFLVSKVDKK